MNALSTQLQGNSNLEFILRSALAKKNYIIYTDAYKLNIVGIRGSSDHSNLFDDSLVVFYYDENNAVHLSIFDETTHPGLYYTQNPIPGTGGAGILVADQYVDAFMIGSHTSHVNGVADTYPCLTQAVATLPVYRDKGGIVDGKLYYDPSTIKNDGTGIQLHRGLKNAITGQVWNWSAACQVQDDGTRYETEWWPMVMKYIAYNNLTELNARFTYTLLDEVDLGLPTQ
jgi:hypothetical protein